MELYRLCSATVIPAAILWQRSASPRRYNPEIGKTAVRLRYSARPQILVGPAGPTARPRFD
jgi:hypothetical protein